MSRKNWRNNRNRQRMTEREISWSEHFAHWDLCVCRVRRWGWGKTLLFDSVEWFYDTPYTQCWCYVATSLTESTQKLKELKIMSQVRRTNRFVDILSTRSAAHLQNTLPILQKVADSTGPFPESYHSLQPSLIPSCFYWIQWPKETRRPRANEQYGGFLLTNFCSRSFFSSLCKQTLKRWLLEFNTRLSAHMLHVLTNGPPRSLGFPVHPLLRRPIEHILRLQ